MKIKFGKAEVLSRFLLKVSSTESVKLTLRSGLLVELECDEERLGWLSSGRFPWDHTKCF